MSKVKERTIATDSKSIEQNEPVRSNPRSATAEVVHCAKLNVRSSPNPKGAVISTLSAGERVVVNLTVENDKFYEILASSGKKGYAMKTYLKLLEN